MSKPYHEPGSAEHIYDHGEHCDCKDRQQEPDPAAQSAGKLRPDILVVFTPDELKAPGRIKGQEGEGVRDQQVPNTMIDGRPYSLPSCLRPSMSITTRRSWLCEAKGPGWHLITNDEWAALSHQSWENDTVPTGNTSSSGKSHSHPEQTGTTAKDSYGKTLAGSGPIESGTTTGQRKVWLTWRGTSGSMCRRRPLP